MQLHVTVASTDHRRQPGGLWGVYYTQFPATQHMACIYGVTAMACEHLRQSWGNHSEVLFSLCLNKQ